MTFAKRVFTVAGVYGLISLLPMYFLEGRIGADSPPPITHPEYYYGFVGVTVAWQILFLVLGRDPVRYRPMMLPAIVEKLSFGLAALVLFAQGRVSPTILPFAGIDLALAGLFALSFRRTADS